MAVAADGACRRARHCVLVARTQLFDNREPGLALHQGEHTVPHITAPHGIALPVVYILAGAMARSKGHREWL